MLSCSETEDKSNHIEQQRKYLLNSIEYYSSLLSDLESSNPRKYEKSKLICDKLNQIKNSLLVKKLKRSAVHSLSKEINYIISVFNEIYNEFTYSAAKENLKMTV